MSLLSDPPVSPTVSSSQDMVRTRSGFNTNDSAPSRSSGCCKRALKELLLFAMDLIILLVGVLQGPISVRILLALVAYTSAMGSPRCLSLLKYLILLRCLSLLGCLNLLRYQKWDTQDCHVHGHGFQTLCAGVSILRYINISILIKYSNFSRLYKKLGPFYKTLQVQVHLSCASVDLALTWGT